MPTPDQPATAPSAWNAANALTLARLLLVPLFAWLLLREGGENDASRVIALVVFAIALVTDRLDGEIARRHDLITDIGKIADPIADKALTGAAFIGLSVLGELPWWLTVLVLAREFGITALRFAVIQYGVLPASRGGKAKTALQGLALGLYILPLPDVWEPVQVTAMAFAVAVTVVTGLDYIVRAVRLRRSARPGPP